MAEKLFGRRDPNARGYYGDYGGKFVPETLVAPVEELQQAYLEARQDPQFLAELDRLLAHYVGRPTPIYETGRLRASLPKPAARMFLKREDLAHTGAHKISNALKDAINEAMRDWVTNVTDTYYLLGSVLGPHPYPLMVREFQAVIGREARDQILKMTGRLPDAVVACVGGGSNALGIFDAFI